MKGAWLAGIALLAALAWTAELSLQRSEFSTSAVTLIGAGLMICATAGLVGVILNSARWAWRLLLGSVVATLALALALNTDVWWWVSIGLSTLAMTALVSRPVTSMVRKRPSATGPPAQAVMVPIALISSCVAYGVSTWAGDDWRAMVTGVLALVAALMYLRVVPGGLVAVRFLYPSLALLVAAISSGAVRWTALASGLTVGALAWSRQAKVAFHPPREQGSSYPIPPELTPREVLDSAGLDDRGQSR